MANDPLNLMTVDGTYQWREGDKDAATWLPPYKPFRCEYVSKQVAVKARYSLWITQPEHHAITGILKGCHKQSPAESTPSVARDEEVLLPCKQFQLPMLS